MSLFRNKYRIESARHQHWDYRWDGAYFITICTHNRKHYFGKVVNGKMQLSNLGIIANVFWYEIKHHAKNIKLGEFVVMPNHMHGILILEGNNENDDTKTRQTNDDDTKAGQTNDDIVKTRHALSLRDDHDHRDNHDKNPGQKRLRNPGKNSIPTIVGGYKSAVTKHANRLKLDFKWQTRYHDYIIRDQRAFQNISNYIMNNPINWGKDKFRPQ